VVTLLSSQHYLRQLRGSLDGLLGRLANLLNFSLWHKDHDRRGNKLPIFHSPPPCKTLKPSPRFSSVTRRYLNFSPRCRICYGKVTRFHSWQEIMKTVDHPTSTGDNSKAVKGEKPKNWGGWVSTAAAAPFLLLILQIQPPPLIFSRSQLHFSTVAALSPLLPFSSCATPKLADNASSSTAPSAWRDSLEDNKKSGRLGPHQAMRQRLWDPRQLDILHSILCQLFTMQQE